jgi:murein DD-endopeptidase MepM/ murein hydrolase activator NlpD
VHAALSRTVPLVAAVVAAVPSAPVGAAELGERSPERGDRGGMDQRFGGNDAALRPTDPPGPGGDPPSGPPARLAPARPSRAYPVDGAHTYGDGFRDRGGSHMGEDVMADCGMPLRAVKDAMVRRVANEAAAGRYVVFHDRDSGEDYVYMHLSAVDVAVGDSVSAGDKVGSVGRTGDATACHLHFEEWTRPGWYAGGQAKDPLAFLKSLGGS